MDIRAVLRSLQLPVAAVGVIVMTFAVAGVLTLPTAPSRSEVFVAGLARIALYVIGWIGFLVFTVGLAIPPGDGYGVHFTHQQRRLFILAGAAAAVSMVGPFAAYGILLSNPLVGMVLWAGTVSVAMIAVAVSVLWRGVQAVQQRYTLPVGPI